MQLPESEWHLSASLPAKAGPRGRALGGQDPVERVMAGPTPLRQCAECGKRLPASKLAAALEVAPLSPMGSYGWRMKYPLCSIACGAVAAVQLLEEMKA